jgi:hypothetical protein
MRMGWLKPNRFSRTMCRTIHVTYAPSQGPGTGPSWARVVRDVDMTAIDGYAFRGQPLHPGVPVKIPVGAVVVERLRWRGTRWWMAYTAVRDGLEVATDLVDASGFEPFKYMVAGLANIARETGVEQIRTPITKAPLSWDRAVVLASEIYLDRPFCDGWSEKTVPERQKYLLHPKIDAPRNEIWLRIKALARRFQAVSYGDYETDTVR